MSICKVCGKEYHGNEENFICIHCKAEKGMLNGQELVDYNNMKREMDANERCRKFKEEFYESKRYDINPIIDRVGGGDSFSGGIIHGLLTKPNQGAALDFAVAASALKHTINGDFNLVTTEEVEALAGGDASGRVQR